MYNFELSNELEFMLELLPLAIKAMHPPRVPRESYTLQFRSQLSPSASRA